MLLDDTDYPKDWPIMHLDRVAKRGSGHTPSKSHPEYWNGNIKWVSLADSYRLDGGYISDTDKKISPEGIKNSSAVIHPPETVILSRDAGVGKSAVTKEAMAVSQHFIVWNCNQTGKVAPWFLYYTLQFHQKELERQAVGSTIKTIGLSFFKNLEIALPPLPEQKKIAAILSTWDRAIEGTEKLLANSQQQKKALMQQLLTGKKRLPGFTGEWKICSLSDVATVQTATSKTQYICENGERFIVDMGSVNRLGNLVCTKSTQHNADLLPKGTLVMPKDDIGGGNIIGRTSYIDRDDLYVLGDHVYALHIGDCDSKFLHFLINSHPINKNLRRRANGTAQLGLGKKDVLRQKIKIPSEFSEQKAIAAVLTTADEEITALESDLSRLSQEKKALMQQLLTGKRRVTVD